MPRLTIRRLMLAVAVVVLVLAIALMRNRAVYYESRAAEHQARHASRVVAIRHWRDQAALDAKTIQVYRTRTDHAEGLDWEVEARHWEGQEAIHRGYLASATRKEVYHSTMARKYLRLARYPWLPVEPDPPEPE